MASSPPASPATLPQRPMSAAFRAPRSSSRLSMSSKQGGGSRASDEDGKTSVRVAVRIRPPLSPTDPGFELIPQRFQRSMVQVTSSTNLTVDSPQGRKLFVFDRVFGEEINQAGVWDYLSESVNAFVQGYNVSLLAYGQSGSGKSYTMGTSGPAEQSDSQVMGVIPRAAGALFEKLSGPPPLNRSGSSGLRSPTRYSTNSLHSLQNLAKTSTDKNWQMKATYVEIYNEQLRDLLVPESIPLAERSAVTIREDNKGRILLTGLHHVTINSIDDLLGALNFGSSIRQTDSTAINAKSSRSHAVFSLNLIQRKNKAQPTPTREKRLSVPIEAMAGGDNWVTIDSKLHFVDLAGSERLKNTGASGDRAKEGISINAGLASLGKVISQLSSRQAGSHVSYRDSKLTRLLQDSLGGNAITYMIACVTPAEFHLSETLNTVQYAQRARAIQSKPRIQQVSDESDKQAVIDRLRAEVSFLRDQIRNTERGDRRVNGTSERVGGQNEREIELQNHLLDIQENYTALSQRHAKLISEITKARDDDAGETPTLNNAIGDSAVERLKRSNSFAEAVEQVVLEYEKTIQSLETSLSNTRSSLSTTESSLLERETKCAYVETVNQQLQARLHKVADRESSTEQYLHDLEAKIDGQNSGEEKHSAVVSELRKEITRIRENEASCEDYISTLEERLAEADQDMELMQRELSRLEHVVERQRSLGKLDNLLYELDHIQSNGNPPDQKPLTNGTSKARPVADRKRTVSVSTLKEAIDTAIPESDEEDGENPPSLSATTSPIRKSQKVNGIRTEDENDTSRPTKEQVPPFQRSTTSNSLPQDPAQSKVASEKLENATRELIDPRVEHESTVNEYDLLSAKYEQALRTLAELQDAVDESHHPATTSTVTSPTSTRPASFLADARVNELRNGGHLSSSRSLSSELFLAGELASTAEPSDGEPVPQKADPNTLTQSQGGEESLVQEIESLKKLHLEKEEGMVSLSQKYAQLHEQYQETLDIVEELKTEVSKAKMNSPSSPTTPILMRKSSQNVMTIDRAHRSLASLGNIASENFLDQPDTMQNFELNLNTAMHELHQRSERVQALEAELATIKKDMENKTTIISGLTRERSSLKASSPMDISVVSSMRDQLVQSENQIKMLHESFAAREKDLLGEIESLNESLVAHSSSARSEMPGVFPETPAINTSDSQSFQGKNPFENGLQAQRISDLENELSNWEARHTSAVKSMEASEKNLQRTIAELENNLAKIEGMHRKNSEEMEAQANTMSASIDEIEKDRVQRGETVKSLNTEIDQNKATIASHLSRIAELDQAYAYACEQVEDYARVHQTSQEQLRQYQDQTSQLERDIEVHKSDVEFHKHGLKSLHDSHSRELEKLRASTFSQAKEETKSRLEQQSAQHEEVVKHLEAIINDLEGVVSGTKCTLDEREMETKRLQQEIERQLEELKEKSHNVESLQIQIRTADEAKATVETEKAKLQADVDQLKRINKDTITALENLGEKEQRASRLVDDLEKQIASTYDENRATSSRMSQIQTTRDQELGEIRAAAIQAKEEAEAYRLRLEQYERGTSALQADGRQSPNRSDTLNSNIRKSGSVTTLPSPPPAIPLPPLPTISSNMANGSSNPAKETSPTGSRHASKELVNSQLAEDQEARIRTIEKHLFAEKQLTATLEEALVDLETQANKVKVDVESWKKKAWVYEDELKSLKKERSTSRVSVQAVEEERNARKEAEAARAHLEERMVALNKKKKKSGFNCF